jgi:hypothetical protein
MKKVLVVSLAIVAMLFTTTLSRAAKTETHMVYFENRSDAWVDFKVMASPWQGERECLSPGRRVAWSFSNPPRQVKAVFWPAQNCNTGRVLYFSEYDHNAPLFWAHGTNGHYAFYHN